MAMHSTPFGDLLRRRRLVAGLTQDELAERAGLSARAISDLERGLKHRPRRITLQLLSEALELSDEEASRFAAAARQVAGVEGAEEPAQPDQGAGSNEAAQHHVSVSASPPQQLPDHTPTNLPDEPTPFIGRQQEINCIAGLLRNPDIRLLTLTGTGGIGKTRLALQVAHVLLDSFQDGVFFVSLAQLSDPALVPSTIAEVLSIKEESGTELLETLMEHLSKRQLLLVLDNCEHLLEAASVVASLLDSCRELRVLATSRVPLHLLREHEYLVPPLSVPDPGHVPDASCMSRYEAVSLFLQRACTVKPGFAVTDENATTVAEICYRLDGLPLAIELAAARLKILPPRALLPHLTHRLRVLTGGPRDAAQRHQTMRDTIAWSYELLDQGERILFHRLSVFVGGWTLEAAERVCNPDGDLPFDVLEGLSRLVDQSLVVAREHEGDDLRFGMLETVREYAVEQAEACGEAEWLRHQHAAYYLAMAEAAESELAGPRQTLRLGQLESELDNFRAALGWLLGSGPERPPRTEEGLRLATPLWRLWYIKGYWAEGRSWLARGLEASDEVAMPVQAKALDVAGTAALFQGDYEAARHLLERGLTLFRGLEDHQGIASSLTHLGYLAAFQPDRERLDTLLEEAASLRPYLTDRATIGYLDVALGLAAIIRGDIQEAVALHEEGLALFEELGDGRGMRLCLSDLGLLALPGDGARARALLREDLRLSRQSRDVLTAQYGLLGLAALAAMEGQREQAVRLWGAADGLREAHGLPLHSLIRTNAMYTGAIAEARGVLGDAAFDAAWQEGRTMRLEQAVDYALHGSDQDVADTWL